MKLGRIPLVLPEVKVLIARLHEKDEMRAVSPFEDLLSIGRSGLAFRSPAAHVLPVLEKLTRSHAPQFALYSVLCAARFMFFQTDRLLPTICQYSVQADRSHR